jgi:hypothetical protein
MRLTNHGIARYAAKIFSDLACGKTLFPKIFELVDPFVGPGHACSNCLIQKAACAFNNVLAVYAASR